MSTDREALRVLLAEHQKLWNRLRSLRFHTDDIDNQLRKLHRRVTETLLADDQDPASDE